MPPTAIIFKPESDRNGSANRSQVTLYRGFPDHTIVHELFHIVSNIFFQYEKHETILAQVESFNQGRAYGQPWKEDDNLFFAREYGKTNASEDMSTIAESMYTDSPGSFKET